MYILNKTIIRPYTICTKFCSRQFRVLSICQFHTSDHGKNSLQKEVKNCMKRSRQKWLPSHRISPTIVQKIYGNYMLTETRKLLADASVVLFSQNPLLCSINNDNFKEQLHSSAFDGKHTDKIFGVRQNCNFIEPQSEIAVHNRDSDEHLHDDKCLICIDSYNENFNNLVGANEILSNISESLKNCADSSGKTMKKLLGKDMCNNLFLYKEQGNCFHQKDHSLPKVGSTDGKSLINIINTMQSFEISDGKFNNSLQHCVPSAGGESQIAQQKNNKDRENYPSLEQLKFIADHVIDKLPKFLKENRHDYTKYRPDLVVENNWTQKPYNINGLAAFAVELLKLKFRVHIRYTSVKANILQLSMHEEDGTVRVRWQVSALPQFKSLLKPFKWKDQEKDRSEWFDGFSIITVTNKGMISKITIDRVMKDEIRDSVVDKDRKEKLVDKIKKIKDKIPKPVVPAPT